jgi:hypothetical protein
LVERLLCKQDVSGSSPLTSTRNKISNRENKEKTNSTLSEEEQRECWMKNLARTLKTA